MSHTEPMPANNDSNHILVVAPEPFYEDRGTPIAVRQLVKALSHLGYEVDLVTYPVGADIEIPGVRLFRAANPFRIRTVPIGLSARKLLLDATLVSKLKQRLRTRRYRFVHALEEAAFPATWLGRRYGVPVVYDMQSSLPEQLRKHILFRNAPVQSILQRCERWLVHNSDVVMCSAGLRDHVARIAPEATCREWHFHSPIRSVAKRDVAAARTALGIPDHARVVLYSGTFEQYQGLRDLVAAVPHLREQVPDAVLVLLGARGQEGDEIARMASDLKLNEAVRIVERIPRDRVPRYLALADVLVSPRTNCGNLPLKVFDYLAAGRPILASDIPTHRSVLDDSRAMLVTPNAEEYARALTLLLRDREHASRLATAALEYATERLGWMAFVDSVSELPQLVRARE